MRHFLFILIQLGLMLYPLTGFSSGKIKAKACIACHGQKGISSNPLWPNLAGQKKNYLIKALNDFKSNRRKDPLMNALSKTLSDADISELADHFSKL